MPTFVILLLIPGLIGGCTVVVVGTAFMLQAQARMEVDRSAKRQAIRWSAVGSVCCGVSFGLLVFLTEMVTPEIGGSTFAKVLIALSLGVGTTIALLGGILLSLALFEGVTLPARRKMRERSQAKKED